MGQQGGVNFGGGLPLWASILTYMFMTCLAKNGLGSIHSQYQKHALDRCNGNFLSFFFCVNPHVFCMGVSGAYAPPPRSWARPTHIAFRWWGPVMTPSGLVLGSKSEIPRPKTESDLAYRILILITYWLAGKPIWGVK